MRTVTTRVEVGEQVRRWREAGQSLAFVPTMGNLHHGHLRLVREAQRRAQRVAVSIFINPTQFNDPDDFEAYPRTLREDGALLAEAGVDLLFMPSTAEMYPNGLRGRTQVEVPELSRILCGAFRPGHFAGVATVVAILFNVVRPELAFFGEKDYQQLLVIRRMVEDLRLPVQVVGVETAREADGLALSSRNRYLTASERALAPSLYRLLCGLRDRVAAGERDYGALEASGMRELEEAGFRPEYVALRRAEDLAPPASGDAPLRLLAAAWLGKARLIDNLAV
jgi:pantoate--beta-alanine ligase